MRWIFTLGRYDQPRPFYPQTIPGHRSQQGSCLGLDERLQDGECKKMIWFQHCVPYSPFQHAMRVLKILNVDDLIDGLVFCDYEAQDFSCKPERDYYYQVRLSRAISWS